MKLPTRFPALLIALFTICLQAHSQNTYPVLSTNVETNCITNCIDEDSIPNVSDSTSIRVVMTVQLFEFTGISSIHVKLGTTDGGSELLDKTFAFDVSGNVGNGCTYSRTGNVINLGLGDYNGLMGYFSEVKIERDDHSLTEAFVFNK
ncbi:MAG: hypothetical protein ABI763_07320 [Bacteroidota bacterium]